MFGFLFPPRLSADEALKTFDQLFKADAALMSQLGAGAIGPGARQLGDAQDIHERQRAAAFKAWETRRRKVVENAAAKPAAEHPAGMKELLKIDKEVEEIAKNVIPNLSFSRFKSNENAGMNSSGFIKTPDGRKMFLKKSDWNEAEVAAYRISTAIGWSDMQMPTYLTKFGDSRGDNQDYIVRDLLPEGDAWGNSNTRMRNKAASDTERTKKVALFEYLIAAGDRHEYNYWVDNGGTLWSIDLSIGFTDRKNVGGSTVLNPRDLLSKLSIAEARRVVEHKEAIITAAKFAGREAEKGVARRVAIVEKAYNATIKGKGTYVNVTQFGDEAQNGY